MSLFHQTVLSLVMDVRIGTKRFLQSSGQSYKGFTIVNYNSRVVPDWKTLHITTLES